MSIESREMDNPAPRDRLEMATRVGADLLQPIFTRKRWMEIGIIDAMARGSCSEVTVTIMARQCGLLPPPDHSEDAGRPWVPPEQEHPKPCHPECSVCGPVFYGTGWPGQDSGAEGEI